MTNATPNAHGANDLSDTGALVNMMKALIGMGILSMPYATAGIGWLPCIIGLALVGWLTLSGIHMAIIAKERMQAKTERKDAEEAPLKPKTGRRNSWESAESGSCMVMSIDGLVRDALGYPWQVVCAFSILLGQYSCGIAYVEVISQSLGTYWHYSFLSTYLPVGVVLMGLCCAGSLKKVAFLSVAALAIYIFVLVALVNAVAVKGGNGTLGEFQYFRSGFDIGTFLGISIFAYGGLPIAILAYDDMKNPQNFFKVTSAAYVAVCMVYITFALLGYCAYGNDVKDVIYFEFAPGSVWREASLVCVVVILAFSFPLQMMPIFTWAEGLCYGDSAPWIFRKLHYTVIRLCIVAPTVVIAYVVPSVTALIGTAGGITAIFSGFLFPAVLFVKVSSREDLRLRIVSVVLFALGIFGIVKTIMSAANASEE